MTTPLRQLLAQYRAASKSEREKGTYFERLAVAFIKNDTGMQQEYEDCWLFSDWAKLNRLDGRDIGIDAVAKIRGEDSYCAIQCKFYREGYRIQKSDIDSFLSSAQTKHFSRGLIIETTGAPWSGNATALLDDLNVTTIDIDRLEASPIDWAAYFQRDEIRVAPPKELRPHQWDALKAVREGLAEADRGKLIMACGTGKTFTGLKIAEDLVGEGGTVLVLVPSLALMSQTIREWTIDSQTPLRSYAVCSDVQVGRRRRDADDVAEVDLHDLDYPATTNAAKLASRSSHPAGDRMTVVFSTYQSIQVISDAQKRHGFPEFDLIICDEAHRTTGATLAGEDESNFVKIHNQDFIAGKKRLYMTATPRVFGDSVKSKASEVSAELASMDDAALYGETLFTRGFGWAVENKLLTDYKVLVLAVDEAMVSGGVQTRLADGTSELRLDDATKIIGCYKALIKSGLKDELLTDPQPMQRALAFCKDIASSKLIRSEFAAVVSEYLASDEGREALGDIEPLECELHHVDGTMGAKERGLHLEWLKETHGDHICRILTNARCLSEGVDVPALDAILFMHPRKSQIDVVQSVGRVMRRAPGKNMGYVILPIGVPAGMSPEEALNDNERYRVVWQILNALRSHDERFDAQLNQADLGVDISSKIEVIAVSNKLPAGKSAKKGVAGIGGGGATGDDEERTDGDSKPRESVEGQNSFVFDEFSRAIMAKIVKKCGRRDYWEDWAGDIAKIAQTHITRITALVSKDGTSEREAFDSFLAEIRDDLNDSISQAEAIEMLAQHLITRPVFDALFEGYSFARNNPVSKAMEAVLSALDEHRLDKEADSLERFYGSVKRRAAGIDNSEAKQRIVVELYDKFFRNAFPKMTERLGIVYTPVEVVDFIIHSVDEVLQAEFGQTLGSRGVHILDPFTGTGTFITRLLQSGLIKPEELEHKYRHEIHANEIVLLAYYIAAINIEAVYHNLSGGQYTPFDGICLTDTFQLYEQDKDLLAKLMPDNSNRRTRQKELDIRVIFGNPPYSVGQGSANDNAANLTYAKLDGRIRATYAARSDATNKNALYDSYIRAIRWASDRIGDKGVVAYVSNAGWLDANTADGLRLCLAEEFASIHVFHLRGNQRTSGERSRREGGKIFGSGSRTPVAIALLVKNPDAADHGQIRFHDIGDYLTREEKLDIVARFGSIGGISKAGKWQFIKPDDHGDWLGQRDKSFDTFIAMGDKDTKGATALFANFSRGVATARDAWCYNGSREAVEKNMLAMISFYNAEVDRFNKSHPNADRKAREAAVDGFIDADATKISWNRGLKAELVKGRTFEFDQACVTPSLYRPFTRQWLYFSRTFNDMIYQMPKLFPEREATNQAIMVKARPVEGGQLALMVNAIPELQTDGGAQCFPEYLYEADAGIAQHSTAQHSTIISDADGGTRTQSGDLRVGRGPEAALHGADEQRHSQLAHGGYRGQSVLSDVPLRDGGRGMSDSQPGLFEQPQTQTRIVRRDGITDEGLAHFQAAYPGEVISKKDLFYYVYGLLHSEDYRARFADNLTKQLPRIPRVKAAADFWHFSKAGRALAALHVNYEEVEPFPVTIAQGALALAHIPDPVKFYRVEKMKFAGKQGKHDKSMVIYNAHITMTGIPLEAYDYVVNGKPALEWVMERQCVKTDKASGIVNDANRYAIETVGDPAYPLLLFQRMITVSLETMKIVRGLPKLDIE
ncbi:DEAD/DEAH box helicase family protein [Sphingomonas sp. BGYR3]|uniref:DEAD/DEAH box helicase n=1 Tax=Sphingomonas sp. BGYR3 TaxID=2975483 RepID=UPI0021A704C5|nr:type ISP restriction/modification enzyme [Sphingomonas sp. BGYR3]MDG5489053.1 DEAD/DEAH box helicase family protein [Sphingomonas sp. BGYR3]